MTPQQLLNHPTTKSIAANYKNIKANQQEAGFNLFTISSYTAHRENFHTDILAALLDKNELHNEGNRFVELFIAYLKKHYGFNLSSYRNSNLVKERGQKEYGRLDIWLQDVDAKRSVIIENKINDAPDRDDQLNDYFKFARSKGFEVDCIVYLSLDGLKKAPPQSDESLLPLTVNIAAFNDQENDLSNGWLKLCLAKAQSNDSKSFLHQYNKLIPYLAQRQMETQNIDDLYFLLNEPNALETIEILAELKSKVPALRTDRLIAAIEDIFPFRKTYRYRPNYWLIEKYEEQGNSFKLDICFQEDGSSFVTFWNPGKQEEEGTPATRQKLEEASLFEEFNGEPRYFGYSRDFKLSDYRSMQQLDQATIDFVKYVLEQLRQ